MKWSRELYELPEGHGWSARPGYKVLVVNRGAVVLEYPGEWFVAPQANQINIRDRPSAEESTCVLAVSSFQLPPADLSGVPLRDLLAAVAEGEEREYIESGQTVEIHRGSLEAAWTVQRFVDERERREARCRFCLARGQGIQSVITLDYWPEEEERVAPVWENVLDSLRLGVALDDPTRGIPP